MVCVWWRSSATSQALWDIWPGFLTASSHHPGVQLPGKATPPLLRSAPVLVTGPSWHQTHSICFLAGERLPGHLLPKAREIRTGVMVSASLKHPHLLHHILNCTLCSLWWGISYSHVFGQNPAQTNHNWWSIWQIMMIMGIMASLLLQCFFWFLPLFSCMWREEHRGLAIEREVGR